jgi:formimidoylglutamate deiminase
MAETQLWFDTALLPSGWADRVRVTIADGRITRVEAGVEPEGERHAIGLPGLPNLHSHGFQRALAGRTQRRGAGPDSFWSWREVMYRFLDRLGPEDVEAITAQAYAEMLEVGFTHVGEFHYLHHAPDGRPYADPAEMAARAAAAAERTGIGLTLLPVFYAHSDFGGVAPTAPQRRFVHDLDGFARLHEACRGLADQVGVAPHSLRAVTPEELAVVAELGGPIHIHAAEQIAEVEACLAWSGKRPVEWLLDHAGVDERWCLVHATHMTPDETRRLAASGAVAGLCPITEADLGDGLFPAPEYLAAGGRVGVGSDSNVLIDATGELRLLEYGQRLTRRGRNLLASGPECSTGGDLFRAALAGGAQVLGLKRHGIAEDAPANLVALKADHPALAGLRGDALLDGWVFSARAGVLDTVWRQGRIVVRDGRHVEADAIADRYRRCIAKLTA